MRIALPVRRVVRAALLTALLATGVAAAFAADPPTAPAPSTTVTTITTSTTGPAVPTVAKPVPPADTKSTPVRFTLQLQRTDDIAGSPVASIGTLVVAPLPTTTPAVTPALGFVAPAPAAPVGAAPATGPLILGSPVMTTLDNNTATLSISGGDLSYTLSLAPALAADGKVLVLWNIRLSGKSLPGATAVTATGASRVETGKVVPIAVVSVTDPANNHRATFLLQGTIVTGDAATTPLLPNSTPTAAPAP